MNVPEIRLRQPLEHRLETPPNESLRPLRLCNYEGFFASVYATLTGGLFITGFALELGANPLHIGIIAAIPLLGNLFQFLGSYLIHKTGRAKAVTLKAAVINRPIWLVMVLLPMSHRWLSQTEMLMLCLLLLALAHLLTATSSVAWLSWISHLVPASHMGRFFGKRNMMIGIAVMTFTFVGGRFLDTFHDQLAGFQILFLVAFVSGLISLRILYRIPENHRIHDAASGPYLKKVRIALGNPNFRRLLVFTMVWSFGVNFGAPFFLVYKLQTLELSYTYVAFLITLTSLLDLMGMRFWGAFSDRVGNRPIMILCSFVAGFLPFGWLWTTRDAFSLYFLFPLCHTFGGFFWAGMNLTSANILIRLAPRPDNAVYFSAYYSVNGVMAAIAALAGGLAGMAWKDVNLNLVVLELSGLKIIFLISWILRCLSIPTLRTVKEPESMRTMEAVRILRSIRSINSNQGFNPLLHFFVPSRRRSGNGQRD